MPRQRYEQKEGIRFTFPAFVVGEATRVVDVDLTPVTCTRCERTHWIEADPWLAGEGLTAKTRPCPYCFKTSRPREATDGTD